MFKKIEEQKDFENFLYETNIPVKQKKQKLEMIATQLNYAKRILEYFMSGETETIDRIDKRIEEIKEKNKDLQICKAGNKIDGKWIPVYKGYE